MKTQKYQLKNGLQVILLPSRKSPVVSVQMWVKTGSADEQKGEEGISHFIEHLVFKGTQKFGVGEIASVVEGAGGELNAYTSFDETVFYVTISSQFQETALEVISEMMGFPTFVDEEINNEREVVIEEIKRGQDSPSRRSSQLLFSTLFKKHSYGIPVIGYDKIIRNISAKKIREYYANRYVPSNMFLVVAGDFDSKEMKQKINDYFIEFHPYKLKKISRKKEPAISTRRLKVEGSPFKQTSMYISWPGISISHKDVPALEMLSLILGQGESSRMVQKLRIEKPLVNGCGSFNYPLKDNGIFAMSLSLEKENLQAALDGLLEVLTTFQSEGPQAEELQKSKINFTSQEIYALETVDSLARRAGQDNLNFGNPEAYKKNLAAFNKLKAEDLIKAYKKYLKPKKYAVTAMTDGDVKASTKIIQDFCKNLDKLLAGKAVSKKVSAKKISKATISDKPKAKKSTDLQEIQLSFGGKLLIQVANQTPSTVVKTASLAGVRAETDQQGGLTEMFSRVWTCGTKTYSEVQMANDLEGIASSVSSFGGRNTVGTTAQFLSGFEKQVLPYLRSSLLEPLFDKEILEREKFMSKNQIKSRNDNPAQVCIQAFNEMVFAGHPYARDMIGSVESIEAITQKDLMNYLNTWVNKNNFLACVVGDVDVEFYKDFFEELGSKLPGGKTMSLDLKVPTQSEGRRRYSFLQKEQSHLVVGHQGLDLRDDRKYALEIIQSILSGQGGRLFLELRDKNSLAYSVSPIHMDGIGGGYFGGYIGCSPEKADKALEMMRIEFKKLCDTLVSEEELQRAQRYLIGRHDIEIQRKSAICNAYLFDSIYGLDPKRSLNVAEDYFSVTPEQIRGIAQEIFSRPENISLVGPTDLKGK